MAVKTCPNCDSKLRYPDDSPERKVKCPKCGKLLTIGNPQKEEEVEEDFEVVDDDPPPAKRGTESAGTSRPQSKRRDEEDDDDEDERPRSRGRDADDDEQDEAPRKKRRSRDEDDDVERPRSKRRDADDNEDDERPRKRRDDDDDDDDRPRSRRRARDDDGDDRPRSRRPARDDDYDDDDEPETPDTPAQYRKAKTGFLLICIGLWCHGGAMGVSIITKLIEMAEEILVSAYPAYVAGVLFLAGLIITPVGCGFLLAGPKKGKFFGLSIALLAIASIRFLLVFYLAFFNAPVLGGGFSFRFGLLVMPSMIPLDLFELVVLASVKILHLCAVLLELGQFILFVLVLKETGRISRDKGTGTSTTILLFGYPVILGVMMILFLIMKLTRAGFTGYDVSQLLFYVGFGPLFCFAALVCGQARQSLVYRKKK